MERGQGRQGREYSGILFGQQKLNRNSIPKYIFELRVDPGDLPPCLVIFPRICQIIILMNYKAVIGTKAASTEWFPTLSKWSLWRSSEELLIAGIENSLSMILQILKHSRLNTQKLFYFQDPTQLWLLKDWNMKTLSANLMAYNIMYVIHLRWIFIKLKASFCVLRCGEISVLPQVRDNNQ